MNQFNIHDFINSHSWTITSTYIDDCPHEYLLMNRLPEKEHPLFPKVARFIRKKGFIAEHGSTGPNSYYIAGDYFYWTLDKDPARTDLINRAKQKDYEFVKEGDKVIIRRRKEQKK